jgi:hypothetical protein
MQVGADDLVDLTAGGRMIPVAELADEQQPDTGAALVAIRNPPSRSSKWNRSLPPHSDMAADFSNIGSQRPPRQYLGPPTAGAPTVFIIRSPRLGACIGVDATAPARVASVGNIEHWGHLRPRPVTKFLLELAPPSRCDNSSRTRSRAVARKCALLIGGVHGATTLRPRSTCPSSPSAILVPLHLLMGASGRRTRLPFKSHCTTFGTGC